MAPAASVAAAAAPPPSYAVAGGPYPALSDNARTVAEKRYLRHSSDKQLLETYEEMLWRVARAIAAVEEHYRTPGAELKAFEAALHDVVARHEFVPGGRTLANAGASTPLVPNCVVLHPKDSIKLIGETLSEAMVLQQRGSGIGFPWHLLRPAGTVAQSSNGVSSGPIPFLRAYDAMFGVIKQHGRNGANMACMRVDHPDVLEFISCKPNEKSLVNFNISVGLTHDFMRRVAAHDDTPWMCTFDGVVTPPRRIVRDDRGYFVRADEVVMSAPQLFRKIVKRAWKNGEPGCLFLDTANDANPLPGLGRIETTNPCGEQYLHEGDICNLGAVNLGRLVDAATRRLDEARLRQVVRVAVRALDNVVDMVDAGVERVQKTSRDNRRIGLGVMGLADALVRVRLGYGTAAGRAQAAAWMRAMQQEADAESLRLGASKGTFHNIALSVHAGTTRRNAALTTIAPTGSTAMIVEASGGCEPHFALKFFKKNVLGGTGVLFYANADFERDLRAELGNARSDEAERILAHVKETGTLRTLASGERADAALLAAVPAWMHDVYATAGDLSPEQHVEMQAALQEHVDNSVSKTVNLPNSASVEDVERVYMLAYEARCKGLTVYRDGSRTIQVLETAATAKGRAAGGDASAPGEPCPDCGGSMRSSEGCASCSDPECGYSRCG